MILTHYFFGLTRGTRVSIHHLPSMRYMQSESMRERKVMGLQSLNSNANSLWDLL